MRAAAAVVAAVAVAAGAAFAVTGRGEGSQASPPVTVGTGSAPVQRTSLVERESVDGTLGYGETAVITNRGQGTVTRLPELGATVDRNGVLFELDGRAVRLLHGTTPAYRRLGAGVDDGDDIEQLERNLRDLGHTKRTPDRKWDEATTAAVKRWEKSLGQTQDGVVEDGEVVFAPAAVRIAEHDVETGAVAQPGTPVLSVTGTTRQIDIDLDARKQRLAAPGAKVEVELPDATTTTGTVTEVGTVASRPSTGDDDQPGGGGDDESTIDVIVVLDDPSAGGSLDGAPVTVRFTSQAKDGVLAVPVSALLALAEGGYAVELFETSELVRVETGLFSNGLVEVTGDGLAEGLRVVVPR